MQRLAGDYTAAATAWRSSPRIAATVATLVRLEHQARDLAETLGRLRSAELGVLELCAEDAHATLGRVDEHTAHCAAALADLTARGADRGGSRRLAALFEMPPRFTLSLAVRAELAREGKGSTRAALCDAVAAVLHLAGEEATGIEDVVRRLPRPPAEP